MSPCLSTIRSSNDLLHVWRSSLANQWPRCRAFYVQISLALLPEARGVYCIVTSSLPTQFSRLPGYAKYLPICDCLTLFWAGEEQIIIGREKYCSEDVVKNASILTTSCQHKHSWCEAARKRPHLFLLKHKCPLRQAPRFTGSNIRCPASEILCVLPFQTVLLCCIIMRRNIKRGVRMKVVYKKRPGKQPREGDQLCCLCLLCLLLCLVVASSCSTTTTTAATATLLSEVPLHLRMCGERREGASERKRVTTTDRLRKTPREGRSGWGLRRENTSTLWWVSSFLS